MRKMEALEFLDPGLRIDVEKILYPFRPAAEFAIWSDYDMDYDGYGITLEWRAGESIMWLKTRVSRVDVIDFCSSPGLLDRLFRYIWIYKYKVPEREPHIILGEN